ncbi:hypothetical protein J4729_14180 [Leisingera sp. HS039]|uniref:hypothetical protein n=1 Tax=unclassified Leisingera TaxID=2614906 RepID=UPI0010714B78|nr:MULTISPECIES: hypothetical protein [unclassified Leisingera]MBQ4825688.1 hypothetical protein [Leisingera sp. HS039]QBR37879.1 hypothetical protein ETW23_18985 [Leisingera sp. NJS201]
MASCSIGISRRTALSCTAAAAAAACLSPVFAATAPAEIRFHTVKLRKSGTAEYLLGMRRNPSSLSQLVLENEDFCLILAGERTRTGARRLEL